MLATLGPRRPEAAKALPSFSVRREKSKDMWIHLDQKWPLAPVLCVCYVTMIVGKPSKKSFAGFVRFFLVSLGHDWFSGVGDEILKAVAK